MSPPVNYCRRLSIASLIDHFLRRVDVGRHGCQAMGQGTYCSHYFNTPSFMSNLINAMIANLLGWGFFPSQEKAVSSGINQFSWRQGGDEQSVAAGLDFHHNFCLGRIFAHWELSFWRIVHRRLDCRAAWRCTPWQAWHPAAQPAAPSTLPVSPLLGKFSFFLYFNQTKSKWLD